MEKRVLITGASGLLGRAVLQEFERDQSWTVLGLAFTRATDRLRKVDITDREAVISVMQEFKPSVVIHSAADRKPAFTDQREAEMNVVNVTGTQNVCDAADLVGAIVMYLSTDYVFDGKKPPYMVTDPPSPLNAYGKTKLAGEKVVLERGKGNAALRVSNLYGEVESLEESPVCVVFKQVKDTATSCALSDYERRYPTHCGDIASVLRQMVEKKMEGTDVSGVYHLTGDESFTKYDMALVMAQLFNLSTDHIRADKTAVSARPYNSQLDLSRVEQLGIRPRSKFSERIKPLLEKFFP